MKPSSSRPRAARRSLPTAGTAPRAYTAARASRRRPGGALAVLALPLLGALSAPVPLEAQDHAAVIEYRQSIMQSFRIHMGGVHAALANTVPMDHARSHATAFQEMARSLANAFPEGSTSADSRALPAIWGNRDGFMNAVSAIQGATSDLVEAAEDGEADAVDAALQAVQGACRGCHTDFRGPAN